MKYLAGIFDVDGTLVDSLPIIYQAVTKLRADFDLAPADLEVVRRQVGFGIRSLLRTVLPRELASDARIEELVAQYRKHYKASPNIGNLFPKVQSTLAQMASQGLRLGVVTNRSTAMAETTLELLLPEVSFENVTGADSVSEPKPSPLHLLEALERMKLAPSEVFYVGDHEVDLECAQGAKVDFFGVSFGYGETGFDSDCRIDRFEELLDRIK